MEMLLCYWGLCVFFLLGGGQCRMAAWVLTGRALESVVQACAEAGRFGAWESKQVLSAGDVCSTAVEGLAGS